MENKGKLVLAIVVIFIIIVAIIFGFKSCQPRKKTTTDESEIYNAFINANIEFTCEYLKNDDLKDAGKAQTKVTEIYKKYNFPVEDNAYMMDLLNKYQGKEEVNSIIQKNTENCYKGGSPIFYSEENAQNN